jgi:hypothetical protein
VKLVLVVLSLVLFALAALSVPTGRVSTVAAGLFCWELSTVV